MQDPDDDGLTRRQLLTAAVGGVALSALPDCTTDRTRSNTQARTMTTQHTRMPVVYLPHGGGPWPFVDVGFGDPTELRALATYLRSLAHLGPQRPRAVLMVSAHWEESQPTVMTSAHPPMLYDYSGFPPESYQITWPAPGAPELAARVQALLRAQGIATATAPDRGYDHGAFVPMKLAWPEADMPTIQLSLKAGLDPAEHLAIGRALAPLRDEGVLILGSGSSYHNMRGFMRGGGDVASVSAAFDGWLHETVALPAPERDRRLAQWASAPGGRQSHPREEHLLPLMVIAGAAEADRGHTGWQGQLMNARMSAFHFG